VCDTHALVLEPASIRKGKGNTTCACSFSKQANHLNGRQSELAGEYAVSRNIDQEIAAMRQEIGDLEKAIARQDPPLAPYTKAIAEAKIARLQSQIAAMKGEGRAQPAPSE
jgi:hypothetical protein